MIIKISFSIRYRFSLLYSIYYIERSYMKGENFGLPFIDDFEDLGCPE